MSNHYHVELELKQIRRVVKFVNAIMQLEQGRQEFFKDLFTFKNPVYNID